jgi:SAM-dependent methyltransferase
LNFDDRTAMATTTDGVTANQAYAADFAGQYDGWFSKPGTTAATVALLAELAGKGPALELGIGTGRVALPLTERGVQVHGVEAAPEMAAHLRDKPGGNAIPVTIGDFAEAAVPGQFSLIYVAAGTFFELPTQQAQLRCLRNVVRHLRPDGVFVLDAFLPEALWELATAGPLTLPTVNGDRMVCSRTIQRAAQRYTSSYSITTPHTSHHIEVSFRYAGMGELDLMATSAGLTLRHRWGGWDASPLRDANQYHVSCYELENG